MQINRLLDIYQDIEKEIYEDQLRHLSTDGISVTKDLIQESIPGANRLGLARNLVRRPLLFSTREDAHIIRGILSLDSNACLFPDDTIEVIKVSQSEYLLKLIHHGLSRTRSEDKSSIFNSKEVVNKCLDDFNQFLSNLTIESFIQFNYILLFDKIGINDEFFRLINSDNYESKERRFNKKVSDIVKGHNYRIELPDVYYYQRYLQLLNKSSCEVNFLGENDFVLKNVWDTTSKVIS